MIPDIKTRQVDQALKVLDKTKTGAGYVKDVAIKSKDKVEELISQDEGSAHDYANNKLGKMAKDTTYEVAHQTKRSIKTGRKYVKKHRQKQKEGKQAIEHAARSYSEDVLKKDDIRVRPEDDLEIRIKENPDKVVAVKTNADVGVKTGDAMVKTAETTEKMAVKTTDKAKAALQKAHRAASKNAAKAKLLLKKSAEATKRVVKKAAIAIKASIKAIVASVKSLIAMLTSGGGIAVLILIVVVLFGGALCMIGGQNATAALPVSAEVEAYEPVIRQYARQYGVEEYVDLIKAIMMQESGGRGLDPMQSSEGPFNTRYPNVPNGITDPDYSIQCGVQEIKSCLEAAGVENPIDMDNIKLALQGYNFGNGYISWAKRNYGGYTLTNAAEFSDMMTARLGWERYGDKQYVSHVLRYYPYGRIPTGMGSMAIVQVALSQEGNVGGRPYWSWYGFGSRVEWCACFVSWCADQCGYIDAGIIPKFALCSDGAKWFDARGQFQDGSYVPMAGDIIFFDWGANGDVDHVGIVEYTENGVVHTIEGNSGDSCRRRSYVIGNNEIYGYGVPVY